MADLIRKHSISRPTYFNWRAKYGGVGTSELKRIKDLEAENAKLKRMYADLALENTAIKDILNENCRAVCEAAGRRSAREGSRDIDRAGLRTGEAIADGVVTEGLPRAWSATQK